jgi:hypothetical protein
LANRVAQVPGQLPIQKIAVVIGHRNSRLFSSVMVEFILTCICYARQFGGKFFHTIATKLEARMQRTNHKSRTTNNKPRT